MCCIVSTTLHANLNTTRISHISLIIAQQLLPTPLIEACAYARASNHHHRKARCSLLQKNTNGPRSTLHYWTTEVVVQIVYAHRATQASARTPYHLIWSSTAPCACFARRVGTRKEPWEFPTACMQGFTPLAGPAYLLYKRILHRLGNS
jgi:hypothetical protein